MGADGIGPVSFIVAGFACAGTREAAVIEIITVGKKLDTMQEGIRIIRGAVTGPVFGEHTARHVQEVVADESVSDP